MSTPVNTPPTPPKESTDLTFKDKAVGTLFLVGMVAVVIAIVYGLVVGISKLSSKEPDNFQRDETKSGDYQVTEIDYKQGGGRHSRGYCHLMLSDGDNSTFEVRPAPRACKGLVPGDIIPVEKGKVVDNWYNGEIVYD